MSGSDGQLSLYLLQSSSAMTLESFTLAASFTCRIRTFNRDLPSCRLYTRPNHCEILTFARLKTNGSSNLCATSALLTLSLSEIPQIYRSFGWITPASEWVDKNPPDTWMNMSCINKSHIFQRKPLVAEKAEYLSWLVSTCQHSSTDCSLHSIFDIHVAPRV